MARTYEQIRSKALAVLRSNQYRSQYTGFLNAIEDAFASEQPLPTSRGYGHVVISYGPNTILTDEEKTLVLEVFWDLFREGIITLGLDHLNPNYPWFRVTERGKKRLDEAK